MRHPRDLTNAVANSMAMMAQFALSLYFVPLLISLLGMSLYGVWILLSTVIGVMSFAQFGLDTSLTRHIAKACGEENHKRVEQYIGAGLCLYLFIAFVGGAIIFALSGIFGGRFFGILPEHRALAAMCFKLAAVLFAVQTMSMWGFAVLKGLRDFVWPALLQALNMLGMYTSAFLLLKQGSSLESVVFASIIWASITMVVVLVVLLSAKGVCISFGRSSNRGFGDLLHFGAPFFASTVLTATTANVDRMMLGAFRTVETIPSYSVPQRITAALTNITMAAFNSLYPKMVARGASDRAPHSWTVDEIMIESTRLQFVAGGTLFLACALCGPVFLVKWIGEGFAASTKSCLFVLCAMSLARIGRHMACARVAMDREAMNSHIKATVVFAIVSIGMALLLGPKYGLLGIAWAYLIGEVVYSYAECWIAAGLLSETRSSYIGLVIRWAILNICLVTAAAAFLSYVAVPATWPNFVLLGTTGIVVGFASHLAFGIISWSRLRYWVSRFTNRGI